MSDNEKLEKITEYLEDEWRNAERLRAGLQMYHFPENEYEKANFYSLQISTIKNDIKRIIEKDKPTEINKGASK